MRLLRASVGLLVTLEHVPVGDLAALAADTAAELVDLRWTGLILKVVGELEGVSESNYWSVDGVDVLGWFLDVPGAADLAVAVAVGVSRPRRGVQPRSMMRSQAALSMPHPDTVGVTLAASVFESLMDRLRDKRKGDSFQMPTTTSPSSDELRELTTHDIAVIVLRSNLSSDQMRPHTVLAHHRIGHEHNNEHDVDFLLGRVSDAWACMVANGWIGPSPLTDGAYRVTQRGRRLLATGTG